MLIIIRAVPNRIPYIVYLKKLLPDAEWCFDPFSNAATTLTGKERSTRNFLNALRIAGERPCVHMEEDVILTKNFLPKIDMAIKEHPTHVIQFFSMRKADLVKGSRFDRNFMMNQCFYLPPGYSMMFYEFWQTWERKKEHPGGYDIMMGDLLRKRKEPYWIHVPSLVQHRVGKSVADPRRSSKRVSLTFCDPEL